MDDVSDSYNLRYNAKKYTLTITINGRNLCDQVKAVFTKGHPVQQLGEETLGFAASYAPITQKGLAGFGATARVLQCSKNKLVLRFLFNTTQAENHRCVHANLYLLFLALGQVLNYNAATHVPQQPLVLVNWDPYTPGYQYMGGLVGVLSPKVWDYCRRVNPSELTKCVQLPVLKLLKVLGHGIVDQTQVNAVVQGKLDIRVGNRVGQLLVPVNIAENVGVKTSEHYNVDTIPQVFGILVALILIAEAANRQ